MTNTLQKHGITFDEARHAYTRNGFPLPSVTQILPFKSEGAEDVIRRAAERGHRVHKWIEWHESGRVWQSEPVATEDSPYLDAWLKFKEITGFELARFTMPVPDRLPNVVANVPMVERFVYHPSYAYVGRLDLIGYLRRIPGLENDLTLVDAKTVAKVYPTTALQTSAYVEAINLELKKLGLPLVKHRWAAQLKPDGTCRREAYLDQKADFSVFLARLNWMRWAVAKGYEEVGSDYFVQPETNDREIEEVMARL